MQTVLLSHRLRSLPSRNIEGNHGAANYSYAIVAERMIAALRFGGVTVQEIQFPGIYTTAKAIDMLLQDFDDKHRVSHFSIKPLDHAEILSGVPNILHCAWEFDKITRERTNADPHTNQLAILKHFDSLLVPCQYQKEVFERAGLNNVIVVPTPIPQTNIDASIDLNIRAFDFFNKSFCDIHLESVVKPFKGRVFLSVLNPFDPRKNFDQLFRAASSINEEALFLFKLTTDERTQPISRVINQFCANYDFRARSRIYFIPNRMSSINLRALQSASDFILSASTAEGQNLPLLESMAVGSIPVAPRHTAMLDYICPETGILIQSEPVKARARASYLGDADLRVNGLDSEGISAAIKTAMSLDEKHRAQLSNGAKDIVTKQYSFSAVSETLLRLLETLE